MGVLNRWRRSRTRVATTTCAGSAASIPRRDYDEIRRLTARARVPLGLRAGDRRSRSCATTACRRSRGCCTRRASSSGDGIKRYDDTILIGQESTIDGIDSERGHAAVRRLNKIHGHYDIPNDEFAYVLATTIVGPVRWISEYGWRPLDPHELVAITRVTTRFGELMGIKGLPSTYDGYLQLLLDFERDALLPRPGQHGARRGVHRHRTCDRCLRPCDRWCVA